MRKWQNEKMEKWRNYWVVGGEFANAARTGDSEDIHVQFIDLEMSIDDDWLNEYDYGNFGTYRNWR